MKLTKKALKAINNVTARLKLAIALQVSEQTMYAYIRNNNDNLTKAAALQVIKEETGLTESEILDEEKLRTA